MFECTIPGVKRITAQGLFNTQQLVVLGYAVRTAQGTGFYLGSRTGDREVCNGRVLGFA